MNSPSLMKLLESVPSDKYTSRFSNLLTVKNEDDVEIGHFSLSIEKMEHNSGLLCYCVHAFSNGVMKGVSTGTNIKTYVTIHLETIEQEHNEYINFLESPHNSTTFITRGGNDNDYVVKKIPGENDNFEGDVMQFNENSMKGFISEGCSLLLERILVQQNEITHLTLTSFDPNLANLEICPVTYDVISNGVKKIDGIEMPLKKIKRTITLNDGTQTVFNTEYLDCGYLVSRFRYDKPITMIAETIPDDVIDIYRKKMIFEKKPLNWETDLQLHSKFIDLKDTLKDEHMSYMQKHPELKAMIADYFQFLLISKPKDVLQFTKDYFSRFSTENDG